MESTAINKYQALSDKFYTQERETRAAALLLIEEFFAANGGKKIVVQALREEAEESGEDLDFDLAFPDDEANGSVDRQVVKLTKRGAKSDSYGAVDYTNMDPYQLLEVLTFLNSLAQE